MIKIIADNIYSPLGSGTAENYDAVLQGRSRLRLHEGKWGLPEAFMASLFEEGEIEGRFASAYPQAEDYSRFEQMMLLSATQAVAESGIDASSPRTLLVLSTTKGNVSLLENNICAVTDSATYLSIAAERIARFFGNPNQPLVVSNACISGVCAIIVAQRNLQSGAYDNAVVIGGDEQSAFIVSGFQSFKALSSVPCKPFSVNRHGLNLGEAAATVVMARDTAREGWTLQAGAIRNDAYHLSSPSRQAEGSYRALRAVIKGFDAEALAVINTHGTATLYNDEMESVAIQRAGLDAVPVNGYKGIYGHTMGAAGVLETILTMHALDKGTLLPTRGFDELGVSCKLVVVTAPTPTRKHAFVKIMSGFGGCNAAILMNKR
ncbi:beta-ketoacyl synthase N-terminal-like domain-containing protein [Segatella maculosa]|uniref:beta-ketoacyl synthase N-terminal-like domain-containing protein n=1 Tax=Segatella maculosa TaxID=439703 RepID=UPI0024926F3B|nr:beta-ketoacyl synthase N-terminal-like domain-containing protein [Segatella maculosa]